jgi:hypothetical protein
MESCQLGAQNDSSSREGRPADRGEARVSQWVAGCADAGEDLTPCGASGDTPEGPEPAGQIRVSVKV